MAHIAVQIGHVNGIAGAAYEEATLQLIFPHVVARLLAAGHQVTKYDGSLQLQPGEWQHHADAALFLHCDSWATNSTGYSVGFWPEAHPGSDRLAYILKDIYGAASGLKFIGYNITIDEAHYYGNRRFTPATKCALIELGFVSNPTERAYLQNNAQRLGYAVADAVIQYFGGRAPAKPQLQEGEAEMILASQNAPVRIPTWNEHSRGKKCYLDLTDQGDKGAKCRLSIIRDNGDKGAPSTVKTVQVPQENTYRLGTVGDAWKVTELGGISVKVEVLEGGPVLVIRTQTIGQ